MVDATLYSGGIAQRGHSGGGLLALEIPPGATEPYLGLGGILPVTETLMPDGEWHGVASSPGKGLDPHPAKLLLDSELRRGPAREPMAGMVREASQGGAAAGRELTSFRGLPARQAEAVPGGVSKERSRRFPSRAASGIPHPS